MTPAQFENWSVGMGERPRHIPEERPSWDRPDDRQRRAGAELEREIRDTLDELK